MNPSKTARQLLAIGLLSTALPGIINDFVHIPDFFRGAMMGLGLGGEIVGIILLRKNNSPVCNNKSTDTVSLND